MGSGKHEKHSKRGLQNPKKRPPLGPNRAKTKSKKQKIGTNNNKNNENKNTKSKNKDNVSESATASQQLSFFLDQYQSANGVHLSSLELETIKDTCILELSQGMARNTSTLSDHMKAAFGLSWKKALSEKKVLEGKIDPGNPTLLIISSSALRSLELLRGLRPLTGECPAAKLFSKHMKIEDQVSCLKNTVNIASGTPSRIKKLIDMEALGLSRLSVVVLDMHTDVKGYSLFTLPQVRDEVWDLYKSYFHNKLLQGDLRFCLYGPVPVASSQVKKKNS